MVHNAFDDVASTIQPSLLRGVPRARQLPPRQPATPPTAPRLRELPGLPGALPGGRGADREAGGAVRGDARVKTRLIEMIPGIGFTGTSSMNDSNRRSCFSLSFKISLHRCCQPLDALPHVVDPCSLGY